MLPAFLTPGLSIAAVAALLLFPLELPAATQPSSPDSQDGWALRPLVRPSVPSTQVHPVDAFLRATLEANRLSPSPEADRRTLIRRLQFDLTGLPPTPDEVAAFVADPDPQAYLKLVDRLLASPRYGEHWARHWLDVVSYADTHGNDHDYARPNAWPYRDYVIRSLNTDKPYPRFVQEQVAGDALFPDDPDAIVALGFLAAGPWDETLMVGVREDTVDHRMAQNLDRDHMVSTVMSTFQSLTVHCARCHNHKFDPVSQRDYYALQAVFAGVDRTDRPFDPDPRTHALRRQLRARQQAVSSRAPEVLAAINAPETSRRIAAAAAELERRPSAWIPLDVINVTSLNAGDRTTFALQTDASWKVGGARPDQDTFLVTARTDVQGIRAFRLEVLPDESLPHGGPGRFENGNLHLSEFRVSAQPARGPTTGAARLSITRALADHSDGGDAVANAIDGRDDTYWSVHPRYGEAHEAVFELSEPAGYADGATLTVWLEFKGKAGHQAGRFRFSACTDALTPAQRAPWPAELAEALRRPADSRTPAQQRELALQLLALDLERAIAALPEPHWVYAVSRDFVPKGSFKPAAQPRPIHLLARGDINQPRELIGPGTLQCLPKLGGDLEIPGQSDESLRRAALARWLTDERNVLTWRSIVNRVWQHHFGRALCDSPNDFGRMGGAPSHPELLDWLALWFRDDAKGSLKTLHRLLVTSAAYRQVSTRRTDAEAKDADNRWLWRMNNLRLTAEEVRDAALQFSGRLDLTLGGPAVVQFKHRDKATFMPDGGAPPFLDYEGFDPDAPESRRRAVYRFVFRTVPDPFMDSLDCPDGSAHTPVRSVSTTALQALAMLNDAFLIRQSEHIATRLGKAAPTAEAQTEAMFQCILQRRPMDAEQLRFAAYIRRHGFANACHLLLNSNEFLYPD